MSYIASTMPIFRNASQVSGYQRPEPPKPQTTAANVAVVRTTKVAFGHASSSTSGHATLTSAKPAGQPSNSNSSCNLDALKAGLAPAKSTSTAAADVDFTVAPHCENESSVLDHPCDGMIFSEGNRDHDCCASPCDQMQWSPQAELAMMCGNIMQSLMSGFGGGEMMSSLLMMNMMNQVKQRQSMAMAQMQQAMAIQQFQAFQMMSQAQPSYPMPLDNPGFGGPRPDMLCTPQTQLTDILQGLMGTPPSMG